MPPVRSKRGALQKAMKEAFDLVSRIRLVVRNLQIEVLRGEMDLESVERSVGDILEFADLALA